ncbi:multicomponent Na+:H+ antiporter subunit D [Lachnospiraceae bacterium G11]|nr:multicomponent Na+:H+ antiporter subunit D [Lachnospiraceae bacterium G11]
MNSYVLLIAIFLPILGGILTGVIPFKGRTTRNIFVETVVIITSIIMWAIILNKPQDSIEVLKFTGDLVFAFKMDGLGMIFAGLISSLWPLATLYSFEYMEKEEREGSFFMFYTITYGVTLGISLSGNLMTMYLFYEMLTIVTVPLVLHTLTREAILASRTYLYYSLGGAAFGFIGFIFVLVYGTSLDFVYGGVLDPGKIGDRGNVLLLIYVLAFLGFGVKAAICPFNKWLPQAGVAPTPVTALLHAVAVVKSGAFAIMRITYYSFGPDFLRGTWAQYTVMAIAIFTIIYGSARALKETHFKRRLAYSTIGNLSYILFGVTIMTPLGLFGALCHMVFHAVMKIASFFCAGAVISKTDRTYVFELNGLGKHMPMTFGIFTISGLALMGVPGLCGFVSKWYLAEAAVASENVLAYVGIGALLISAILTAVYTMTISVRAFFPGKDFDDSVNSGVKEAGIRMLLPLCIFAVCIIVFGVYSKPLTDLLLSVAMGGM